MDGGEQVAEKSTELLVELSAGADGVALSVQAEGHVLWGEGRRVERERERGREKECVKERERGGATVTACSCRDFFRLLSPLPTRRKA